MIEMKKLISTISLIYFLFTVLIGIGVSMHTHHNKTMASCVLMQEDPSVCPMTTSISEVRSLFSGVTKSETIKVILALSVLVFFVSSSEFKSIRKQIKFKFFQKLNFKLKTSDHIFSELYMGILNPKLH